MNILLVAFAVGLLVPAVGIFMKENMNTKSARSEGPGKSEHPIHRRDSPILRHKEKMVGIQAPEAAGHENHSGE